ncbi:AsmA family protein [Bradyrhizobium liaoningense]|uniref:AsmA family protein n=1 Tax=Bradyrhizobium liaoningense TaxID=43992 RepID=UPI001BA456FC|nr:AsmA family protein [Bradyrhizobium liaoningense]MBR0718146.1 AsmA family protein [Bradyrhizobium liaoningense]
MAQGMKRLGTPIAALLGVVLIALIATSWLINRDALRKAVEAQIRAVTGLELTVAGSIDVSVLPASYVSFHDVGLKGGGGAGDPALHVEVLTANLRLLPLLLQRFEIADLMLLRPKIHVALEPNGESNWTPFIQTIARTMKPGAENQISFSEIRIQDGVLNYEDTASHATEKFEDIDLSLAWPSISRSFAATGQFDWRGERVDGSISFSDFAAALSGDRSGLKARIVSAPLKVAFDGSVANRTSPMMEGTLTIDSPSLRNALRWTGQPSPASGGFGRFALKARANVVGASIALTNVNVELDGNVAEGVMTYANNGRQTLQATLAADALDFTPYISTFRLLASGARDWNRQLFDLNALLATDLDMRLSAAKLTVGPSKLGRTAIGANLRNGTLALSVGEAQVYGGIAKGSFNIARSDTQADVKAQFQFTDVDLQACATELFGVNKLSGRGNISVALVASGSSPFGLASSLDGTATVTGQNGAISGFNAEQLLKRLERRPLSGGGNFRTGSTPYDKLNVALKFSDGIATAQDIRIEGPSAKITLTGTASVPAREYDMKGVASLNATSGFELPFVVQGPWDDPLIFPDPESLIRRSPASAPLLDAVKDRKTRDAVRSVLERFTGGKQPASDTAPAPTAENGKENAKSN